MEPPIVGPVSAKQPAKYVPHLWGKGLNLECYKHARDKVQKWVDYGIDDSMKTMWLFDNVTVGEYKKRFQKYEQAWLELQAQQSAQSTGTSNAKGAV